MTDYSPFIGRPSREPKLQRLRTLWTLQRNGKTVTAALYETDAGRELRVHYGENIDNLLDSLHSRTGDFPLVRRARELRSVLESQEWTEP